MNELLAWLRDQKGGLRTYQEFRGKALALRAADPENAALARLLADLAGRFADIYDGEPLPVDIANDALARLTAHVEKAARTMGQNPAERLAFLNELAVAELS